MESTQRITINQHWSRKLQIVADRDSTRLKYAYLMSNCMSYPAFKHSFFPSDSLCKEANNITKLKIIHQLKMQNVPTRQTHSQHTLETYSS